MTPHEEIEYICNAAYLRGCDSNFKTAIAAMQESEKGRLSSSIINVCENGVIYWVYDTPPTSFYVAVNVYGACGSYDAEIIVDCYIDGKEQARLAELVKIIKEQSPT